MASGEPGFETVVSRLADILVVQAVRAHLAQTGGGWKGWLRALVDPQIGRVLSFIHEKPEDDWTVESLASKVGVSRRVCLALRAARRGAAADVPDALADAEGEPPARDESRGAPKSRSEPPLAASDAFRPGKKVPSQIADHI